MRLDVGWWSAGVVGGLTRISCGRKEDAGGVRYGRCLVYSRLVTEVQEAVWQRVAIMTREVEEKAGKLKDM